ncbi:MAG: S66 peptidase family protein [Chitinophagaceae bacterium]
MKRKHFLGSMAALLGGGLLPLGKASARELIDESRPVKIPPYLKPGDTIGITSPAGYITLESAQPAIDVIKSWGYQVKIGATISRRHFTFGGSDEERLQDLQAMLDDRNIKAILCARGGYGAVRIVDRLDWKHFKQHPKWVIGFSDITVLHNHIHRNCHVASIHSKMTNSFPAEWATAEPVQVQTINSIHEALMGQKMNYSAAPNSFNKMGTVTGLLVGGNLKTIESLSGSASDLDTTGKILFVEDTGEYLYSIDRMFWNLKRSGKLKGLKGLIVGGFNVKPDTEGEEFGKTLEEIVLEKVGDYNYPVCFDFPVGHQRANFALKCGVPHRLHITAEQAILTQLL